jgi:methylmalonyl-CoA/ethylmalonyl-CoA epimerase
MERLHHVGFVVPSIADAVDRFIAGMGLRWDGQVFHDPVQTVRVTFLQHPAPEAPQIELVEPASPQSRVAGFLKRGGGLHHLCYEVDSLDARIESALAAGAVLLLPPAQAVAFSGRRIAWMCTPDKLFVEYLERCSPASIPQPRP